MLNIMNINNNANSIRVHDYRNTYSKIDLLLAAERVKNAKHANINRRGGRISLAHNINCSGVIKHKTPRELKHKIFINQCIDEYGDGFTTNISDDEYFKNIITVESRDFCGINNGDYEQLYCDIESRADQFAGEIIDVINCVNDYYNTVSEAVADMLYIDDISAAQADAVQQAAHNYYCDKINFNEYAAELLTALTPHNWECEMLRGSCQRDYIYCIYPADVYTRRDIDIFEAYFFGMYCEYNTRYKNETCTFYFTDNLTKDEIIDNICAYFGVNPAQVVFNEYY